MNEEFVRKAVGLAKQQGVLFDDKSPTFRPENNPRIYHIAILINTSPVSEGHAYLDEHLSVLENFTEISLANRFIRIFNELNIERQAKEIDN